MTSKYRSIRIRNAGTCSQIAQAKKKKKIWRKKGKKPNEINTFQTKQSPVCENVKTQEKTINISEKAKKKE